MKRIGAIGISLTCLATHLARGEQDEARAVARKALAEALDGQPKITGKFEEPSEGYHQSYLILQKAYRSTDVGERKHLREQALGLVGQVKERFPNWKPDIVDSRIQMVRDLLARPDGE